VSRRRVVQGLAAAGVGVAAGNASSASAASQPQKIWGPIQGGARGRPQSAFLGDIARHGYLEAEYFVSGAATAYAPVADLGHDGQWAVTPGQSMPYVTRLLVRRPREPVRFNGTVVAEWANVSSGLDVAFMDLPGLYDGCAYVLVSAQRAGVHGVAGPAAEGMLQWDPQRYAPLSIPGESLSYDIFSQAGRVLGRGRRPAGVDPLGGLRVRQLIAVGVSQSGARLVSYANAIQPRDRVYDAIMPIVFGGAGAGFGDATPGPIFTRIRTDLTTPVMAMNSESEASFYIPWRQPDSPRFVYWEVAGASHISASRMAFERELAARDGVSLHWHPSPGDPPVQPSQVSWAPTADAAIRHVRAWLSDGRPPPSIPPMQVEPGDHPAIRRDGFGNALGGVRLPELEVPIARYAGNAPGKGFLLGHTEPFAPDQLAQLYPTHADYVAKVEAAADAAVRAGVILPERARAYRVAAQSAPIPA